MYQHLLFIQLITRTCLVQKGKSWDRVCSPVELLTNRSHGFHNISFIDFNAQTMKEFLKEIWAKFLRLFEKPEQNCPHSYRVFSLLALNHRLTSCNIDVSPIAYILLIYISNESLLRAGTSWCPGQVCRDSAQWTLANKKGKQFSLDFIRFFWNSFRYCQNIKCLVK